MLVSILNENYLVNSITRGIIYRLDITECSVKCLNFMKPKIITGPYLVMFFEGWWNFTNNSNQERTTLQTNLRTRHLSNKSYIVITCPAKGINTMGNILFVTELERERGKCILQNLSAILILIVLLFCLQDI